jgi:hypothetical protein
MADDSRLGDLLLFQQIAKAEDCGFIRDPSFHSLDPCKAAEAGCLDQLLLVNGSVSSAPLQQMDPQHHLQRNRLTVLLLEVS